MLKFLPKIFNFFRNSFQFLQIVLMFFLLLLVLYWTENISEIDIIWLDRFQSYLNFFVYLGSLISDGVTKFSGTVFEHKYICSFFVVIIFYFSMTLLSKAIDYIENLCNKCINYLREEEEKFLNLQLNRQQVSEQNKIKKYVIFFSIKEKTNKTHSIEKLDINEHYKKINKFLIEKTGTSPESFENGFLYHFANFEEIDNILDIYFNLLNLSPLVDYQICVQACYDKESDEKSLKHLISFELYNKITLLSETAYRYNFNKKHKYKLCQMGIYQRDNGSIEALCFEEAES